MIHLLDPGACQTTTYTGTAGTLTGFPPGAQGVAVFCTTTAHVAINATATTAYMAIPANTLVYLKAPRNGAPFSVSAIQAASGGSVYATPVNAASF